MRNRSIILALILLLTAQFTFQKKLLAVVADPTPIQYKQPDGTIVTIKLKGDEFVSWAESLDGYTLLSDGNNGWAYAVLNADGDLVSSGILTHNQEARTTIETSLLTQIPKKLRYSQKQIDNFKSSSGVRLKSATATSAFTPTGTKKLLLILIDFTDQPFNNPSTAHDDFNGLLNTVGYSGHNAHGSVHDFFYEASYGKFDLTTDVVGPYHAAHDMAYYGENVGSDHSPKAGELITEAVLAADPDVNYADYANPDGTVEGVYVVFAGYGEATSGLTYTIWPHAGSIPTQTLDNVKVSRYSCSNELTAGGTDLTTIGVICHEFGHVCGAPDFYDTDYDTNGQFDGTGYWDVMANGVYDGTPSGSSPAHFNPYTKTTLFGWTTATELTSAGTYSVADITSNPSSTPQIYKVNTNTSGEYFLIENRQQTKFNAGIPGHGLIIYHKNTGEYNTNKNTKHPQGFYPVCASSTTAIPTSDPDSYGDINSTGCPFPGSSGKRAFYDTGTPSSKSWAGVNTDKPITNVTENGDGTVTFTFTPVTTCSDAPATQASAFVATPTNATTMDISWVRGNGDNVLVVVHEGRTVDFDPQVGTSYTANTNFKLGSEVGAENYVVYNGAGTSVTLTGLTGNTEYFFSLYEYNSSANPCYLKPALTGNGTTNCDQGPLPYVENFERSLFGGCWTQQDHIGNGQIWKIGTFSAFGSSPSLTGNYAYLSSVDYGSANSQNVDLISPTLDLSSCAGVKLEFNHYFKGSTVSTGTVSYSVDNGSTWTDIQQFTSSTTNPAQFSQSIIGAEGKSQVKFKWNYTGTYGWYWAIDDIKVSEVVYTPSSFTATTVNSSQINLGWNRNTTNNDVIIAFAPTNSFGTPLDGTSYSVGATLPGGGTVLYKGDQTTFSHTSLTAGTTYYYKIWSVSSATNKYSTGLTPISETTDCNAISALPFEENFSAGTLPSCWRVKDNTGQGNWQFGTTSDINYTPALTGNYAYFKGAYGVTHNYNADLISPTFNFSSYGGVMLSFSHLFDASGSYPSTGKVYYSIDNGNSWSQLASFSSDSPNPEVVNLGICAVAGQANVKFKWTYSCSPTGAYLWGVDDISISETSIWTGTTSTNWHTASNWCSNAIPTAITSVIIPTGVANMPYISNTTVANCKDITLQTGTTLKMAANTELDVKGNWVNNGNLDYTNSNTSALVKFNGTSTQTYSGSTVLTLRKFEVDNTSGITLQKELRADDIALKNGIVLTTGTAKLNLFGGTLTKTNGWVNGILQKYIFTNPSSLKTVSFEIGDASNYTPVQVTFPTGSITVANGLAIKTTSGNHPYITSSTLNSGKSINRYWSFPYNGITFSSCNIVFNYLPSDLNASVNTNNLLAGKYASSTWTYPIVGTKTSTSTQITGVSSLGDFQLAEGPKNSIVAGGNWSNPATWSPSGVPNSSDNIQISSPGTVVVDVSTAVCNEVDVQNGAKLQINPTQALTIGGTLTNNSDASGVTIRSDATGTGSLIAGTASGTATIERYMGSGAWHMVSSPVSESVSDFLTAPANSIIATKSSSRGMKDYLESTDAWSDLFTNVSSGSLGDGNGYAVWLASPGTVNFTGSLQTGSPSIPVSHGKYGWNLVGNPYSSAIAINPNTGITNFINSNSSEMVPSYVGIYYWDGSSYKAVNLSDDAFYAQVGQGFFVKAMTGGGTISFTPAMQSHQTGAAFKSAVITWPEIKLKASLGTLSSATKIKFNEAMSRGLDLCYDAGMMKSGFDLYTKLVDDNGVDFTIQCLPLATNNETIIPVGLESSTAGTVTFSVEMSNLPAECKVTFEDRATGTFTPLTQNSNVCAVQVDANSTVTGRFFIHTSQETSTLAVSPTADDWKIYTTQGQIRISGTISDKATASIYDVLGRKIGDYNLQKGSVNNISCSDFKNGVYLLNIKQDGKTFTRKIVVNNN